MRRVLADACYLIALVNRHDELHEACLREQRKLRGVPVLTTDEILAEVLNYYSGRGPVWRRIASDMVTALRGDASVVVVEQSRATFDLGLDLYRKRNDKEYSLADCISFELMRREGIDEALTNDHHFAQEGFTALLRN